MTGPTGFVDCTCGHAKTLHPERNDDACRVPTCDCEEYRPASAPDVRRAPTAVPQIPTSASIRQPSAPGPSFEQIIAAGKRTPQTSKLADRIESELDRLRQRLAEQRAVAEAKARREREAAEAKAEVDRLTAELAAAKAKLRGDRTPPQREEHAAADPRRASLPGLRPGLRHPAGPRCAPLPGPRLPESELAA